MQVDPQIGSGDPVPAKGQGLVVNPQIGTGNAVPTASFRLVVTPRITMKASIPVGDRRPWQRKWRDTRHAYDELVEAYKGPGVHDDDFTRCIESFFKTCRELADWIDKELTGRDAVTYVNTAPWLKIGDALAQTAKHHTRDRGITAKVSELFGEANGARADIVWTDGANSGTVDALKLADDCLAEWQQYFQRHGLNPNS
jgi:hypothetical protein